MTIDAPRYRQLIGHFPTGVTVITTAVGDLLHGMTANALTSVSLNPIMLLVCVDHEAHAHAQLEARSYFTVNILTAEQEAVSRIFAEKGPPERNSLRGVPYRLGANGVPVLTEALAYIECEVADRCPGGDHTIFLGRVLDGAVQRETAPLVFYRGGYRRIED